MLTQLDTFGSNRAECVCRLEVCKQVTPVGLQNVVKATRDGLKCREQ